MSRIIRQSNFRVEVYPRGIGDGGWIKMSDHLIEPDDAKRTAMYKQACEEIVPQIKRHVNGVSGVAVVCDDDAICSNCGAHWTETGLYNGGCCSKDEEANPENVEAST